MKRFALILFLSTGCGYGVQLTGPMDDLQREEVEWIERFAAMVNVKVQVNFVPEALAPRVNVLDPTTQKVIQLPAAGWVSCTSPPTVNINVDDLELEGIDYYRRVAAHEVCHVLLGDTCKSSTKEMEESASRCAEGLMEGL